MVLVVAKDDTRVDLKALAKRLGLGRLSFGKRRSCSKPCSACREAR